MSSSDASPKSCGQKEALKRRHLDAEWPARAGGTRTHTHLCTRGPRRRTAQLARSARGPTARCASAAAAGPAHLGRALLGARVPSPSRSTSALTSPDVELELSARPWWEGAASVAGQGGGWLGEGVPQLPNATCMWNEPIFKWQVTSSDT